ncbi:dermonecrotic toxin domain-containing protein [Pseudomonas sp. NPDC090755]|uniref:dermonecrotic toxin domain-containing protein n=1 Tax=Pseudomonas sp. NPDC090755 TaxID=3364481 RepID=UPI00383B6C5C
MSDSVSNTGLDLQRALALEFASRPTLRSVFERRILEILVEKNPQLLADNPGVRSAAQIILGTPADNDEASGQSLPEAFLAALAAGTSFDFTPAQGKPFALRLGSGAPVRLAPPHDAASAIESLSEPFNDLLVSVYQDLQRSQVRYWREPASSGVSRAQWLAEALKMALAQGVSSSALTPRQKDCVWAVLAVRPRTGSGEVKVYAVDEHVVSRGKDYAEVPASLLLEHDNHVLWCEADGQIQAFATLDEFAQARSERLARHYYIDSYVFDRHELQGDVFSVQAALLLNQIVEALTPVDSRRFPSIEQLEQGYAALTDPSAYIDKPAVWTGASWAAHPALPGWLSGATRAERFEYQARLLGLTLAQAQSGGKSSMEGILPLHEYARQQLRAQMRADHPVDANYFSDDLQLTFTVAAGNPGFGAGQVPAGWGISEKHTLTLTQYAIGNLCGAPKGRLTSITHAQGQLIMDWLTAEYLESLVQVVDIGGHYPAYVQAQMADTDEKPRRVLHFAGECRTQLPLIALQARIDGEMSEAGYRRVTGLFEPGPERSNLNALAFKRRPDASQVDSVTGVFVITDDLLEEGVCVLYAPLDSERPLREFASPQALLDTIAQPGPLQTLVLDWIEPHTRSVYDNGGFLEPHLPLQLPVLDPFTAIDTPAPAQLYLQRLHGEVEAQLYGSRVEVLVRLAELQSVSNAESRWATLMEGAWLLFNVAVPLLRGPVAGLLWLVQGIASLQADLRGLREGSETSRSAAVVDLLMNAAAALFHGLLPAGPRPPVSDKRAISVYAPVAKPQWAPPHTPKVSQGKVVLGGSLKSEKELALDFSWGGGARADLLSEPQRQALRILRASVALSESNRSGSGSNKGLYFQHDAWYAHIQGFTYRVRVDDEGVRVIDPLAQPGAAPGPWLMYSEKGGWQWDLGLRLRGGGPKKSMKSVQAQNKSDYERLKADQQKIIDQYESKIRAHDQESKELQGDVEKLNKLYEQHSRFEMLLAALEPIEPRTEEQESRLQNTKVLLNGSQTRLDLQRLVVRKKRTKMRAPLLALFDLAKRRFEFESALAEQRFAKWADVNEQGQEYMLARGALVLSCNNVERVLLQTVDWDEAARLARGITDPAQKGRRQANYTKFTDELTSSLKILEEIIPASERLEDMLPSVFNDVKIKNTPTFDSFKKIVEERAFTALQYKSARLKILAELSVDRNQASSDSELTTLVHRLKFGEVRAAGETHALLGSTDCSVPERIKVLENVLVEYGNARAIVDVITLSNEPGINRQYLAEYKNGLAAITETAEVELAEAIREQESLADRRPSLPPAETARKGKVIRLKGERTLIVEEAPTPPGLEGGEHAGEYAQLRDPFTREVLVSVHQHEEGWVQVDEKPLRVAPPPAAIARAKALKDTPVFLAGVAEVVALGKRYLKSAQPKSFTFVVDLHVDKLDGAIAALDAQTDSALISQASEAVKGLRERKRELLIDYHLNTPEPTAESLAYLYEAKQLQISRIDGFVKLAGGDYLQKHQIRRLRKEGEAVNPGLWEAHFHYPDDKTNLRDFSKGHLKLWAQRGQGRKAELEAAKNNNQALIKVYRADLKLAHVEDILNFQP